MTEPSWPHDPSPDAAQDGAARAERALAVSDQRFRALLEASAQAVWWTGADGEPAGPLPSWERFTGLTSTELRERGWLSAVHPDDAERTHAAWRAAVESGTPYTVVHRVGRRDGEWRQMVARAVPVRDDGGAVREWVGIEIDVTDQPPGPGSPRSADSHRARIFETLPAGAAYVQGARLTINPAVEQLTGYSREEIATLDACFAALFGARAAEMRALYESDRAAGFPTPRALPITTKSGGRRYLEFTGRRTDEFDVWVMQDVTAGERAEATPRDRELTGPNQDVTERRRLEEQFLQAQKMEAVGQLAGGIAHDFNNLLTAIGANADLSLAAIHEANPAQPATRLLELVSADLAEIRRATNRAADLTRQLLAFSRRQVLEPRPVDVKLVVTDAMPLIRRLVSADIAIDTVLADARGTVTVDPRQLEQVLMNLVVNARDAVRGVADPRITVGTLDVSVAGAGSWGTVAQGEDARVSLLPRGAVPARRGLAPGSYTVLLVHDSGCGMSAETQARAFEPFFTTKGVGEGTGLGLATVYGIVKQSGGYVYVDSAPGAGTLCSVYLPCSAPSAGAADARAHDSAGDAARGEAASARPSADPVGTILLVEDETAVRAALKRLLERAGHRIFEARDGGEALAIWGTHGRDIDLVLTDVVMPELGGLALVERLRAQRAELPVLFISGHSETAAGPHAPVTGARTEWLSKPFQSAVVLRTLAQLLRGADGRNEPGQPR
jgi:PAS domain S-box-containing protein